MNLFSSGTAYEKVRKLELASIGALNIFSKIQEKLAKLNQEVEELRSANQIVIEQKNQENEELLSLHDQNEKVMNKLKQILE